MLGEGGTDSRILSLHVPRAYSACCRSSLHGMRSDVGADTRLVKGVDVSITTIEHAIQLQNVAVGIGATELVASSLMLLVLGKSET